jgi:hypothetical protein
MPPKSNNVQAGQARLEWRHEFLRNPTSQETEGRGAIRALFYGYFSTL